MGQLSNQFNSFYIENMNQVRASNVNGWPVNRSLATSTLRYLIVRLCFEIHRHGAASSCSDVFSTIVLRDLSSSVRLAVRNVSRYQANFIGSSRRTRDTNFQKCKCRVNVKFFLNLPELFCWESSTWFLLHVSYRRDN